MRANLLAFNAIRLRGRQGGNGTQYKDQSHDGVPFAASFAASFVEPGNMDDKALMGSLGNDLMLVVSQEVETNAKSLNRGNPGSEPDRHTNGRWCEMPDIDFRPDGLVSFSQIRLDGVARRDLQPQ